MSPEIPGEYIIGAAAFVVGTIVAINAAFDLYFGLRSYFWPTVSGRITERGHSSGVHRSPVDDAVLLAYAYTVDGERYVGARFDYAGHNSASRSAELERQFPLGGRVTVYYDPKHPSHAVLRPGIGLWNILPVAVSVPMMYYGFAPTLAIVTWALRG